MTETSLGQSSFASVCDNIKAFRNNYPEGKNYVASSDIISTFERKCEDLVLTFVNMKDLVKNLDM